MINNNDNYIFDNSSYPYGYPSIEHINSIDKFDEIFVFGSNLRGRHGKGAALQALNMYGAKEGVGIGPSGNSYAIPTKDSNLRVLSLKDIASYVNEFINYAKINYNYHFLVTKIGCGLAGYKESDIAPLFKNCKGVFNIHLPETFIRYLKNNNI